MLPAITISDFIGAVKIGLDTYAQPDFAAFVDSEYPKIVREVLGQAAYAEIAATDPLPQKWIDVFEGAEYLEPGDDLWSMFSQGLRKAAIYRLYFLWAREANYLSASTGFVANANENSVPVPRGDVFAMAGQRWNDATDMIRETMRFIESNKVIAADVFAASVPVLGTARLTVDTTMYLAVGDTATVSGTGYVVTAILEETWIELAAVFTVAPVSVYWEPFKKYRIPCAQQGYAI